MSKSNHASVVIEHLSPAIAELALTSYSILVVHLDLELAIVQYLPNEMDDLVIFCALFVSIRPSTITSFPFLMKIKPFSPRQ